MTTCNSFFSIVFKLVILSNHVVKFVYLRINHFRKVDVDSDFVKSLLLTVTLSFCYTTYRSLLSRISTGNLYQTVKKLDSEWRSRMN